MPNSKMATKGCAKVSPVVSPKVKPKDMFSLGTEESNRGHFNLGVSETSSSSSKGNGGFQLGEEENSQSSKGKFFTSVKHIFGHSLVPPIEESEKGLAESSDADERSFSFHKFRNSAENLFHSGQHRATSLKSPMGGKMKHSGSFHTLTELAGQSHDPLFRYSREDFTEGQLIGKGAFGRVYRCTHKASSETIVLKVINKNKLQKSHRGVEHMREEQITLIELARKDIPFAIKTIGAFKDGDKLYFIMEEAQGGGLFDILRHAKDHHFTEKVAKFYAAECLIFLKYLHQQAHVVYRDLKPENLMVDREGHLVIIDFGLCKHLEDGERTMSFVGTPDYMAPEIIKGSPYSFEVDFWSFGCLIFEMINGYSPFETKDEQGNLTFTNIMKHSNEPRRHRHGVSPEARMLIDHLLQANRQSRLGRHRGWTAVQAHPWFQNVDWKCCAEKRLKPPKVPKFRQKVMENQPSVDSVGLEGQEIKDAFESFDCVVRAEPQTPTSKLGKQPIFSVSFVEEKNVVNVNKDDDLVHLIQEARLEESHSKECSSQLPNAKDSSTSPARSPPIADQSSSENVLLDVSQVLHVTGKPGHAGQDSTTHKGKKKKGAS